VLLFFACRIAMGACGAKQILGPWFPPVSMIDPHADLFFVKRKTTTTTISTCYSSTGRRAAEGEDFFLSVEEDDQLPAV